MEGNAKTEPWRPFRVDLEFIDADYGVLEKIVRQHQRQYEANSWAVFGTGFAVAFLGAWLATETAIVSAHDGGLIVVLVLAGFYIGMWSPSVWTTWSRGRFRGEYRKAWFESQRGASVLVRPQGILIRNRDARGFYSRAAITAATLESGFVTLWRGPGESEMVSAIPARLLTPQQRDALLSLAARPEGDPVKSALKAPD